MSNLKDTYNLIAEDWHRDHQKDDWWVEGTDKFVSFLSTGVRVLDVGCGSGVKAKYLSNKGVKVVGLDLSDKMIEIARREVSEAEFIVGDMAQLANVEGEFDGIFMQASLLHIPKAEAPKVLASLNAKLKKGGYFYVGVKALMPGAPEEEIEKENDYGYEYERFFSYYSLDELRGYFKDLDLEIVRELVASSGKRPWIQVIGRKL